VREKGLGGVMYWEHSLDYHEVLLDVLYEQLR
jgi:GH18 family chitinase